MMSGASPLQNEVIDLSNATGCISTDIYESGSDVAVTHTTSSKNIINDGNVEYDLDTLQVKVDYKYVDFGIDSANNATIISGIFGQVSKASTENYQGSSSVDRLLGNSGTAAMRAETLTMFRENDTSSNVSDDEFKNQYDKVKYGRIVAKVSVKIKVYIPYHSGVLQWFCKNFRSGENHYGIKLYNYDTNGGTLTTDDEDGVWYQYTKYFIQSRG
jgi:hypothetical protein